MIRYIYRLTFQSGKTYIGQRTYKGDDIDKDYYMGSSNYKKNNPDDVIIKKEIIISGDFDNFTLNLLETDSIIFEKIQRGTNCVNGTYGGLFYRFLPRIKGIYKPSKETIEKIKKSRRNVSKEVNNRISNSVSQLWKDENYRNRQKESHKGNKTHYGYKNSPEQIKHISDAHKGIRYSEECKQKHSILLSKRMNKMRVLYSDYKIKYPEIKWNDFLSKYSKGEINGN